MTARGGTPSPQWERFVVTGKARARIRRFVHQQQREQNLDVGRAELTKAFRQAGVDGSAKALEPALKALKFASVDDLTIAVGAGNLSARDVVHAAYPELRQTPRAPRMVPALPARPARPPGKAEVGMEIAGLIPGMEYHFAGCCHAVPGDEIVGIIANGKGVTIHARDCPTLEAFAATPERFIDVGWNAAGLSRNGAGHTARVSVIAANEPKAVVDVANAVTKHEGSVAALKTANRQQDFVEILLDVDVHDLSHLIKVIAGLRALSSVKAVERAKG
jgi:GTP pyrophosphokinase